MVTTPERRDRVVAAATLYGEADPNNPADAEAIIRVIANRAAWPSWWGSTPTEVCLSPYQFSCWNWRVKDKAGKPLDAAEAAQKKRLSALFDTGDPETGVLIRPMDAWFARCERIAEAALDRGGKKYGVNHYYADYLPPPGWAKGRVAAFKTEFQNPVRGETAGHAFFHIPPTGGAPLMAQTTPKILPGWEHKLAAALVAYVGAKLAGVDFIPTEWLQANADWLRETGESGAVAVISAATAVIGRWWNRRGDAEPPQ